MKMQIMDLDFAFSNRLITETLSNIHFLFLMSSNNSVIFYEILIKVGCDRIIMLFTMKLLFIIFFKCIAHASKLVYACVCERKRPQKN